MLITILLLIFFIGNVLIGIFFLKRNLILGEKVYLPRYNGPVREDKSIFVSVASYRDVECTNTLKDMYEKASFPGRVFVGLVQQNKSGDQQCAFSHENIHKLKLDYTQARGPCYARYLASCLYKGESYFFQIDSHTKFNHGWDTDLVEMLEGLPSKNAVISNYPVSWSDKENTKVPHFKSTKRYGKYYTYNPVFSSMKTKHETHLGSSGCMLFMRGEVLKQVYFDSELDWVFDGEEFLYSARLYTYGYDFYRPTKNVVYHFFGRKGHPKFWDDLKSHRNAARPKETVEDRMQNPPPGYFGTVRDLKSYTDLLEKSLKKK